MKKFLLFVFSTASSLITLMFTFRIAENFFFDKIFYQKSSFHGYSKEQRNILNSNEKNLFLSMRSSDLQQLVSSFKDERILGSKKDDKIKIAIIGDSFAYGLGVRDREKFGDVLEKSLKKISPNIEVFTYAQPGDSIIDNYAKYQLAKQTINPDLYIITMIANDAIIDDVSKYPNSKEIYDLIKNDCKGNEFKYDWPNLTPERWHEVITIGINYSFEKDYINSCYIKTIVQRIVADKKSVIFYAIDEFKKSTDLNDFSPEYEKVMSKVMEKYIKLVSENKGKVLNPYQYDNSFKFEPISQSESHPSKKTHYKYATILEKYLNENKYLEQNAQ